MSNTRYERIVNSYDTRAIDVADSNNDRLVTYGTGPRAQFESLYTIERLTNGFLVILFDLRRKVPQLFQSCAYPFKHIISLQTTNEANPKFVNTMAINTPCTLSIATEHSEELKEPLNVHVMLSFHSEVNLTKNMDFHCNTV